MRTGQSIQNRFKRNAIGSQRSFPRSRLPKATTSAYPLSYLMAAPGQSTVQALAVETMLAVDRFLTHVSGGFLRSRFRGLQPRTWASSDARVKPRRFLGMHPRTREWLLGMYREREKSCRMCIHREHHEIKGRVWRWYYENRHKCPSLD